MSTWFELNKLNVKESLTPLLATDAAVFIFGPSLKSLTPNNIDILVVYGVNDYEKTKLVTDQIRYLRLDGKKMNVTMINAAKFTNEESVFINTIIDDLVSVRDA